MKREREVEVQVGRTNVGLDPLLVLDPSPTEQDNSTLTLYQQTAVS